MGHLTVRRTAWALGGLLIVAVLLFGRLTSGPREPFAPPPAPPADGAALFARHCGACHDAATLPLTALETDPAGFLADHGEASVEEDRAIVEFLSRRAGASAPAREPAADREASDPPPRPDSAS